MKVVNVRMSSNLLLSTLGFPKDTTITNCRVHQDVVGEVVLTLHHKDLPSTEQGKMIPFTMPVWDTQIYGDDRDKTSKTTFSWGV